MLTTCYSNAPHWGYLLASTLLVFIAFLGTNLIVGGTVQMLMGLIGTSQFIGFVVSFAILILFAIGFTAILFRNVSDLNVEK